MDVYGGMANVLLAHDPTDKSEIFNDLNGQLLNFWHVLKNQKDFLKFKRMVEAAPFSERLFEISQNRLSVYNDIFTDVERAFDFFIVSRQSRSGDMKQFATTTKGRTRRGMNEQVSAWLTSVEGLPKVHARLIRVLLRNSKALDLIAEFDNNRTVLYLDPPYHPDTREDKAAYGKFDMTVKDHEDLCAAIKNHKGFILLSGYDNDLYRAELKGWQRFDFQVPNNVSGSKTKRLMVESVFMNYGGY